MKPLLDILHAHWCPTTLLGIALALLTILGVLRPRNIRGFTPLLVSSIALAVASIGGLILSPRWGGWLLVSAIAIFIGLFLLLALSGVWWRWPAYVLAVLALLGGGGLWLNALGA